MFAKTEDRVASEDPAGAGTERRAASVGIVAVRLAEALCDGAVLFVAADEHRAEAVGAALRAAAPEAEVIHCPSSDALPGDPTPASPANIGRRVAALHRLRRAGTKTAFVTTAEAAARGHAPPAAFDIAPPALAIGDAIDVSAFAGILEAIGYRADDRVDEPGEMAVRGQVIDLFPADAAAPVRIEIADRRIVAIRAYDPVTQLGETGLDSIEIGRIAEPPPGEQWVTLFDHLPDAAIGIDAGAERRRDRHVALARDGARETGEAMVDAARWNRALKGRRRIDVDGGVGDGSGNEKGTADGVRFVEGKAPLRAFGRAAKAALAAGDRVVVLGAARDLRFLAPRIARIWGAPPTTVASWADVKDAAPAAPILLAMPVERGWTAPGWLVVAAADLLGGRASIGDAPTAIDSLRGAAGGITVGDVVVHEEFGIGVVAGLEAMAGATEDDSGDAIVLEHAGGARRLVAVADADRLWRYGADADAVTLDTLDGSSWRKRRGQIDAAVAESARALTALAAERDRRTAAVLEPDSAAYERFSAGFAFTETADQARAIAAVRADLLSGKPMDRLVVGDVGYGKTEVALRAAALVTLAGAQVAVAAPTTVLVRQHLETFRRRFAGTDIVVAGLSRLSSAAEKKAVKAGLADGSIHIAIGTAAVAGKGVAYHKLALVVIDEEQRFGAADKARLRALDDRAHVLTLTATPIPRTLQAALIGLQQVSVIATPPARRQPIHTRIAPFDPGLVRAALLRERARGGQGFVVVSRIADMAPMAARLAALAPDLRVLQAHGKMPAGEIDDVMMRFASGPGAGGGDVLLATNIIEAGLDVPRANTMIVWRADRFGLSQLHQLRGRVGRGGRRGQILLLTDGAATIADATLKRLATLQAFDRLGAGFAISARDLDLRGAGDLLGEDQAGHMKLIGVDLYQHLLEGALRAARGETVERWTPQLHVGAAGRLPDTWIPEVELRIELYARLARIDDVAGLDAFEAELEDRFGAPPAEAATLLTVARLRVLARAAGIARVDAGPSAIAFTPRGAIRDEIAAAGLTVKGDRLLLSEAIDTPAARIDRLHQLLEAFADG